MIRGQSYASLWNLLGYPAGVVPVTTVAAAEDQGAAGLPVGVQVAARERREDVVLGLMRAIGEGASDRPPYLKIRMWYGRWSGFGLVSTG